MILLRHSDSAIAFNYNNILNVDVHTVGSIATPTEGDFLFAFATPNTYVCHLSDGGSYFIQILVKQLCKKLHQQHFQDILLSVTKEVAEYVIDLGSPIKRYRQIPSVVSQMRDKIWFKVKK